MKTDIALMTPSQKQAFLKLCYKLDKMDDACLKRYEEIKDEHNALDRAYDETHSKELLIMIAESDNKDDDNNDRPQFANILNACKYNIYYHYLVVSRITNDDILVSSEEGLPFYTHSRIKAFNFARKNALAFGRPVSVGIDERPCSVFAVLDAKGNFMSAEDAEKILK